MAIWESLEEPWQACLEEAWTAGLRGCMPIGAAVADGQGKVIARGRNRIGDAEGSPGTLSGQPLAHAEINALIAIPYDVIDPHDCTLYTTVEPCPLCLGALYMSGVRTLRFACRDPYAGSANLLGTTAYMRRKPVRSFGPQRQDMETILCALHVAFILGHFTDQTTGKLNEPATALNEAWRQVMPASVLLGERLSHHGLLGKARSEGWSAQRLFDTLADQSAAIPVAAGAEDFVSKGA